MGSPSSKIYFSYIINGGALVEVPIGRIHNQPTPTVGKGYVQYLSSIVKIHRNSPCMDKNGLEGSSATFGTVG